ncbi:MAG: hypothetical protein JST54_19235 [Deltaproteobacteria bacterium]|nr:hypothetical protein [Deltaproteobacteria bacterium]
MRPWLLAVVAGLLLLVIKTWCLFNIWALPWLLDVGVVLATLVVLTILVGQATQRQPVHKVGMAALILVLCSLDIPIAYAISDAMVENAKQYCEALGKCADAQCPALTGAPIPALPNTPVPWLLQPGYSIRYSASFNSDATSDRCKFPDPFPVRADWEGEHVRGGSWTWENLMD